jgi:outer membrane protein assembly factor BamB
MARNTSDGSARFTFSVQSGTQLAGKPAMDLKRGRIYTPAYIDYLDTASAVYGVDTNGIQVFQCAGGPNRYRHLSVQPSSGRLYYVHEGVQCRDGQTGALLWDSRALTGLDADLWAVSGGAVYVSAYGPSTRVFQALDSYTGAVLWQDDLPRYGAWRGLLASGNAGLWVGVDDPTGTGQERLYCLDAITGRVRGSLLISSDVHSLYLAGPMAADESALYYVGGDGQSLYRVAAP